VELVTRIFLISPPAENTAALEHVLARLAQRKPGMILSAGNASCLRLQQAFAARTDAQQRCESALDRVESETAAEYEARVLLTLDGFSREFQEREVLVVLPAEGIRAALAHALGLATSRVISPEPCQPIALDWPHPLASEFRHALIGIGFDWDIAPAANKVHKFPGGASVTHGTPR